MKITFRELTELYKKVTPVNQRRGDFFVADEGTLSDLKKILDEPAETGIRLIIPFDIDTVKVGSTVKLELGDPRTGLGLLADSFEDVLNFPKGKFTEPRYYLLDSAWWSGDDNGPAVVKRYRLVLEFINLLTPIAAYLDKESSQLVFISAGKFILPVKYTTQNLEALDVHSLEKLLGFFSDDMHREQKHKILEKVICQRFKNHELASRFSALLAEISVVLKELNDGYGLFAADFSYEKVVNQLEVAKLEELAKINKIFSDIQNQILGIPVATVIVATQLKTTKTVNDVLWINSAILVGVWIFVVLINLVLRNQMHTLDAIQLESDRKKKQIENEFKSVKKTVDDTFELIYKRLSHQRYALQVIGVIVSIGFVLAHVVYLVLTEPAYLWFKPVLDLLNIAGQHVAFCLSVLFRLLPL